MRRAEIRHSDGNAERRVELVVVLEQTGLAVMHHEVLERPVDEVWLSEAVQSVVAVDEAVGDLTVRVDHRLTAAQIAVDNRLPTATPITHSINQSIRDFYSEAKR